MRRKNNIILLAILPAFLITQAVAQEIPEELQKAVLAEYPDRDLNGDGKLSMEEYQQGKRLPPKFRNKIEREIRVPAEPDPFQQLGKDQQAARMAWFREAKFGLFIHWGVYAEFSGYYKGEEGWKYAEHIMRRSNIPLEEYKAVAATFNPVGFDAEEWVKLAKEAGMKYLVITAKHHDGFSMYDSAYTDYDIVEFTPFKRDPFKELAEACKTHGIRFCIYYSHMDWIYTHDTPEYNAFRANQVVELIEKYDPGILWFDDYGQGGTFDLLQTLRKKYPNLIVNDRVTDRKWGHGDYRTPEQSIPKNQLGADVDWETCMTLNHSWGYHKGDHNWKSTEELIHKLIDIASKGGNFLLNIGPDGKGVIPPESVVRLQEVGKWMQVNGEAIYGTTSADVESTASVKFTARDGKLYAFILDWPSNGKLELNVGDKEIKNAYLLADKIAVKIEKKKGGVSISLPGNPPDPTASVLVLEL